MLALLQTSPKPRSRGVFDQASGRFFDSFTRKPVCEINKEEYLKRLRMVHCQHLGTKPKEKKHTNLNNGSHENTEVNDTDTRLSSSDNFTTKWGSYMPYSSCTDVTSETEQREVGERDLGEQRKGERVKDEKRNGKQMKDEETAEQRKGEQEKEKQLEDVSEAEKKTVEIDAVQKETTKRDKRWYDFIFKREYKYEPIWYKYRKSKSLWDGMPERTSALSTSRIQLTGSTPSSTSMGMSKSLLALVSQSPEDGMNEIKLQDNPDRVKTDKKKYIWRSFLCCCQQ